MYGIVLPNGTELHPGDWLHITFNDGGYVGRFSGVYENSRYGLMYRLSYAKPADGSRPCDTVYCIMKDGNGMKEALGTAVPIEKPVTRKGALVNKPIRPGGASLH